MPQASAWFGAALNADGDLNAQHDRIGKACGMRFKDDFLCYVQQRAAINPVHVIAANVTETEVYDEWLRLVAANPKLNRAFAAPPLGA